MSRVRTGKDWVRPLRGKTRKMVDPVGWDEKARRVHDCTPQPDGTLLHHSTCWCRCASAERPGGESDG